jgi:hypothetical protein
MKLNFTDNEKHMLVEHLMKSHSFKRLIQKTVENEMQKLKYDSEFMLKLSKVVLKSMSESNRIEG